MLKLVLFDFDGVLVDSLPVYEETVTACLQALGSDIVKTREDFLSLFDDNFYEALAHRGVDLLAFAAQAEPLLNAVDVGRIVPRREVIAAARKITQNIAIVSSNSAAAIVSVFQHWGLTPFSTDILGSEFRYSKKDKIAHAREKFGAGADETVYIGDTVGDVKEAHLAGVRALAVSWGWHGKERLASARPDFLVDTTEAMLSALATLS